MRDDGHRYTPEPGGALCACGLPPYAHCHQEPPCLTCAGSGRVTVSEPSRRGVGAPYLNPVTLPCPDCRRSET